MNTYPLSYKGQLVIIKRICLKAQMGFALQRLKGMNADSHFSCESELKECPAGVTSPTRFWSETLTVSQVSVMTLAWRSISLTTSDISSSLFQIDWQVGRPILTFCIAVPLYGVIGTVIKLLASDPSALGASYYVDASLNKWYHHHGVVRQAPDPLYNSL